MINKKSMKSLYPTHVHNWYHTPRWRKERKAFLVDNPLCVLCKKRGKLTVATVVDHIKEHKWDYNLFWDINNWQSLCASCHSGTKRVADHHGYSQACGTDGLPLDESHPWNK